MGVWATLTRGREGRDWTGDDARTAGLTTLDLTALCDGACNGALRRCADGLPPTPVRSLDSAQTQWLRLLSLSGMNIDAVAGARGNHFSASADGIQTLTT